MNTKIKTLFILLLILIIVIGFILAWFYGKVKTNFEVLPSATPILSTNKSLVTLLNMMPSTFSKRQFNTSENFLAEKPYPTEILKIGEEDLVDIGCGPALFCNTSYGLKSDCHYPLIPSLPFDDKNEATADLEGDLSVLVKQLEKTMNNALLGTLQICTTKNKNYILLYRTSDELRGPNYIGLLKQDGAVQRIATINETGLPYGGCELLQLTKSDILYYQCMGGDGPYYTKIIYKADLANKTSSRLTKCVHTESDYGITTSCE
jgi:hypothetical protein